MTHFRETQDYHFGQFDSWYGLHTSNFCPGLNTEYDYCSGIELVHPWQVVAQACAGRGYPTLLVLRKCRRCWNHRLRARKAEEKEQTRVSDVWGHNHPRSNHIYDDGHMPYGSLYLSTNSNVHWCAWKICCVLYQCPDDWSKPLLQNVPCMIRPCYWMETTDFMLYRISRTFLHNVTRAYHFQGVGMPIAKRWWRCFCLFSSTIFVQAFTRYVTVLQSLLDMHFDNRLL